MAGLAPAGVLFGFGAAFVASGLSYGLPMAVQPMKAISAVLLTGQLAPGAVAAAGLVVGAVLLLLGATGLIARPRRTTTRASPPARANSTSPSMCATSAAAIQPPPPPGLVRNWK